MLIIKIYVNMDDLVCVCSDSMLDFDNMSEFRVLMLIACECDAACSKCMADKIIVNGIFLDTAVKKLSCCVQTVRNCVCSLCKKGFLLRDVRCRGVYYLNPYRIIKGVRCDIADIVGYLQGIGITIQH